MREDSEGEMNKILLAGVDLCEFGWGVSTFWPAVRHRSREFDKTVCVCMTGHDYLVADFADEILHHDEPGNSDRWLHNGKKIKIPQKIVNAYPGAVVMQPRWKNCTQFEREYFKYGQGRT